MNLAQEFAAVVGGNLRSGPQPVREPGVQQEMRYERAACSAPACRSGWDWKSARDCAVCQGLGVVSRRVWA